MNLEKKIVKDIQTLLQRGLKKALNKRSFHHSAVNAITYLHICALIDMVKPEKLEEILDGFKATCLSVANKPKE